MIEEQRGIAEAEQLLESLGFTTLPIRPHDVGQSLCHGEFKVVMERKPFSSAILGVSSGNKNGAVIYINDGLTDAGRYNFTAAHEIGHVCMHIMPEMKPSFSCGKSELTDQNNDPLEQQANGFASGLLMPRSLIKPLTNGEVAWANIKTIATKCETSFEATFRRMMKFTKEPVALVFHRNGQFKRYIRSDNFEFFIANTPLRGTQLTYVRDGLGSNLPDSLEEVDASDWVNVKSRRRMLRALYVSSIQLKEGFVYSILSYDDDCFDEGNE